MEINIRINKPFGGYAEGQVVRAQADDAGTPLELIWRRRLKDAERDGCCEVIKEGGPRPNRKSKRAED